MPRVDRLVGVELLVLIRSDIYIGSVSPRPRRRPAVLALQHLGGGDRVVPVVVHDHGAGRHVADVVAELVLAHPVTRLTDLLLAAA
jgi:hypothetical protein